MLCSYFLYTPLLPACATGTVEERSIVEPVRKVLGSKVLPSLQRDPVTDVQLSYLALAILYWKQHFSLKFLH